MIKRLKFGMKFGVGAGALALAVAAALPSRAVVVNPGFEGFPDFTGYTTAGNATIQASDFRVPAEGVQQGVITTGPAAVTGASAGPVSAATLATFLGTTTGSLNGLGGATATEGSGIKQVSITAIAGDTLTFSYDFATNENPADAAHNDFSVVVVNGTAFKIADTFSSLGAPPAISGTNNQGIQGFARETGYKTFTINLAAGLNTVSFGVLDVGDFLGDSALLVDNLVQAAGTGGGGGGGVPLPAGLYLLPLGLALAGLYSANLRRSIAG